MATLLMSTPDRSAEHSHNMPLMTSMFASHAGDAPHATSLSSLRLVAPQPLPATAQRLLTRVDPVSPDMSNQQIFARFAATPLLRTLPLVKNGIPLGIVKRQQFIAGFSQSHRFAEKICTDMMQHEPLLVEKNMPLEELGSFLAESDSTLFTDGFIITEGGRYIGVASAQDVLRELSKMHLDATRHANPLTSLPGNAPTDRHIEHLIDTRATFIACHANLSPLRTYNQTHGYQQGDELIRLAARILDWACDAQQDFIGHVGGGDFILLMQSRDWKSRCKNALDAFNQATILLTREHDTHNSTMTHASLCIGAIKITPDQFASHHQVRDALSDTLSSAKRSGANDLFVAQRTPVQSQRSNP